jgi:hypothetical protein
MGTTASVIWALSKMGTRLHDTQEKNWFDSSNAHQKETSRAP